MNKLKELRLQKGLSQKELSNTLNIEYQNYNKYELDKNEPNIETLKKIADFYDVSIDFIVGRARPFDFPIVASDIQKRLIKQVLQLEDDVCEIVEAQVCAVIDAVEKKKILINKFGD